MSTAPCNSLQFSAVSEAGELLSRNGNGVSSGNGHDSNGHAGNGEVSNGHVGNGHDSNGHATVQENGHQNEVLQNGHTNGHSDAPAMATEMGLPRTLHRLAAVRRQQGVSQRNIARRLSIDIATVRQLEEESTDLPISVLYQWQKVLEVPISELLVDSDAPLSPPVMERARMVKVMKTVAAIVEKAESTSMKRLVQMLCDQLLEIMPELTDVAPWHAVGQRRTLEEYGRVVERQLPDDMFRRHR